MRCRYCDWWVERDLVPSLRGGFRCREFYSCLSHRHILPHRRLTAHEIIGTRRLIPDEDSAIFRRCYDYFFDRVGVIRCRRSRTGMYFGSGGTTWPHRSMNGSVDMPGQFPALDDLDYRRELARLREVCRVESAFPNGPIRAIERGVN